VDALWDTGAQVSIISKSWNDAYLPDVLVRDISELLGERELDLQVANGTAFLYDSRIEVEFQIFHIGFNVIEEVVKQRSSIGIEHDMTRLVQTAFLCLSEVKAIFNAISCKLRRRSLIQVLSGWGSTMST
ncbi:unnamed protein product, partial [Porites evermanni]